MEKDRQLLELLCNMIRRHYIDKDKKVSFFQFLKWQLGTYHFMMDFMNVSRVSERFIAKSQAV